jgi:hypothetical protein
VKANIMIEDKISATLLKPTGKFNVDLSKKERLKKVWFFQYEDEKPFAAGEAEAWSILRNKNKSFIRPGVKLIGVSDGILYQKGVMEASKLTGKAAKDRLLLAFEEELEAARGHIEMPKNQDVVVIGAPNEEAKQKIINDLVA